MERPSCFLLLNLHSISVGTKEAAFVYALASATVVHTVASVCATYELPHCGCDTTLRNQTLPNGEKWGGCSPDIDFSVNFAEKLLHRKEDNTSLNYRNFISQNSKIGRSVSGYILTTYIASFIVIMKLCMHLCT